MVKVFRRATYKVELEPGVSKLSLSMSFSDRHDPIGRTAMQAARFIHRAHMPNRHFSESIASYFHCKSITSLHHQDTSRCCVALSSYSQYQLFQLTSDDSSSDIATTNITYKSTLK